MFDPLDNADDAAEFGSEFERMRLREIVLKNATARPRRKSERAIVVKEEFSLPWSEFQMMTKREIWDKYVKEVVRQIILRGKRYRARKDRGVRFFRFDIPEPTRNRRIMVFDKDGVFAALMVKRCVHECGAVRQMVAEFTFRVEIERI